jgi:hypothetical protein
MSYGTVQVEKMTTESGYSLGAGDASSFKNRLINGGMVIDQRRAGASVANNTSGVQFVVDRMYIFANLTNRMSYGQNLNSVTPPAGFINYSGIQSTTANSPASTDNFIFYQWIEGFNVADLAWGTANAKPITVSFWARSSLTGTMSGSIINDSQNRAYPFTYTVSSANTWEYKTVTIPGDTTGTWLTNNGSGLGLIFNLGSGSSRLFTAGSWQNASSGYGATGSVNILGTSGATWYITGVQLEVGTVATSFDTRSIGTELALCQRYFISYRNTAGENEMAALFGSAISTTGCSLCLSFPVEMRTRPSITFSSLALADGVNPVTVVTSVGNRTDITSTKMIFFEAFVASGLTQFRPYYGRFVTSSSGSVQISAEL